MELWRHREKEEANGRLYERKGAISHDRQPTPFPLVHSPLYPSFPRSTRPFVPSGPPSVPPGCPQPPSDTSRWAVVSVDSDRTERVPRASTGSHSSSDNCVSLKRQETTAADHAASLADGVIDQRADEDECSVSVPSQTKRMVAPCNVACKTFPEARLPGVR